MLFVRLEARASEEYLPVSARSGSNSNMAPCYSPAAPRLRASAPDA